MHLVYRLQIASASQNSLASVKMENNPQHASYDITLLSIFRGVQIRPTFLHGVTYDMTLLLKKFSTGM